MTKSVLIKYSLPSIIWAILIFILCIIPLPKIESSHTFDWLPLDKITHSFMFFILAFLMIRATVQQAKSRLLARYGLFPVFIIAALYGAVIELYQYKFLIHRTGDLLDLYANLIGITIAIIISQIIKKKRILLDLLYS